MILLEVVDAVDQNTRAERMAAGAAAQRRVRDELKMRFGQEIKNIKVARVGSKLFDIEAKIHGQVQRIEVKSTSQDKPYFAFFDTFVTRGEEIPFLDRITGMITKGKYTKFSDAVEHESDSGFPNPRTLARRPAPGDVPKSGRVPGVLKNITDRAVLDLVRAELLQDLVAKHINYLAIFDRSGGPTAYYHISGENLLNAPKLPLFRQLHLDTYGGAFEQAMRVVIRIAL